MLNGCEFLACEEGNVLAFFLHAYKISENGKGLLISKGYKFYQNVYSSYLERDEIKRDYVCLIFIFF